MGDGVSHSSQDIDEDLTIDHGPSDVPESQWAYLTEGNANVIFQYSGKDARLRGFVIRLQKQNSLFNPTQQIQYFSEVLSPRLDCIKAHILGPRLTSITPKFIESCAANRNLAFGRVPRRWQESGLTFNTTHGILLPSLLSVASKLVLEFKPKWLCQSSRAPAGATLCRTCALRCFRQQTIPSRDRFCPLDLVSQESVRISRAVRALNLEKSWHLPEMTIADLIEYLSTTPVLLHLGSLQRQCEGDLPLCMTLRDCSVYLVLTEGNLAVETLWIADLDRKSATKQAQWDKTERELIDGGWYHKMDDTIDTWPCIL